MVKILIMETNNKPVLAALMICAIWIMWFGFIGMVAKLCNYEYFWLRVFLEWPFTILTMWSCSMIWKHHNPEKNENIKSN